MMFPFYFFFNAPQMLLPIITFILSVGFLLFGVAFVVFYFICKWRLFVKAGQKGWKSIIPIYSIYIFIVKICGIHWVFCILFVAGFVSYYSIVASILILTMCFYNLAKRFNRRVIFVTLCSIVFAPFIIVVYGLLKECIYDSKIKISNCGYFNQK